MKRADAGFTLLEVMVALALLGLSVIAMLQLLSGAADAAGRARAHSEALALAQSEMDRLIASGAAASLEADGTEDSFRPPFQRYRYAVTSGRVGVRGLIEIGVRVTWPEPGTGVVELLTRAPLSFGGASP